MLPLLEPSSVTTFIMSVNAIGGAFALGAWLRDRVRASTRRLR